MASQVVAAVVEVLHISSYVRGYHAYMEIWTSIQDEILILKREPTNVADKSAIAAWAAEMVWLMWHLPYHFYGV